MGFMRWWCLFFSTFTRISITITCNSDPQHWLTIVTCVLPNNLGMLGGILSRLTDMWDEAISTRVVVESHGCVWGCNWFIYFTTKMPNKCEICYCNTAAARAGGAIVGWRWGKVSSRLRRALAILPNLPRALISRSLKWNLLQHAAGSVPNRFIYSQCKRRLLSNGAVE